MPSRDVGETMAQGGRLGVARRVASSRPFSWDFSRDGPTQKHKVTTRRRGATRAYVQGRGYMPCGQRETKLCPFKFAPKQLLFVRWVNEGVSKSAQRRRP